jgi:hypothetical protein
MIVKNCRHTEDLHGVAERNFRDGGRAVKTDSKLLTDREAKDDPLSFPFDLLGLERSASDQLTWLFVKNRILDQKAHEIGRQQMLAKEFEVGVSKLKISIPEPYQELFISVIP